MFCPNCKAEYREGILRCSECDVDLVFELPAEPDQTLEYVDWVKLISFADLPRAFLRPVILRP
jgi:hypothetical protein